MSWVYTFYFIIQQLIWGCYYIKRKCWKILVQCFAVGIDFYLLYLKTCRKWFSLAQRHTHITPQNTLFIAHWRSWWSNTLHPKCSFSYCLQCEDYYTIYPLTCLTIEKGQVYKSGKSGDQNCVLIILSPETLSIPGVGNLLVVLCRSNVAKSLSVPTHPNPPYFYVQQPLKHIIETFVLKGCKNRNSFKRIICFYLIKDSIFYEIIITVFQFTQHSIENCSMCHAWHLCHTLSTPGLYNLYNIQNTFKCYKMVSECV